MYSDEQRPGIVALNDADLEHVGEYISGGALSFGEVVLGGATVALAMLATKSFYEGYGGDALVQRFGRFCNILSRAAAVSVARYLANNTSGASARFWNSAASFINNAHYSLDETLDRMEAGFNGERAPVLVYN